MTIENVLFLIKEERQRQDKKWGSNRQLNSLLWAVILGEEVGEVANAVLEQEYGTKTLDDLKKELVQVAAVCVAWLEMYD